MLTFDTTTMLVVVAVLLFFALGIAILVLIDHKARLPGGFVSNPFSIVGARRDHPYIAFLTAAILLPIIAVLVLGSGVAVLEAFGVTFEPRPPEIVTELEEQQRIEKIRRFHNTVSWRGEAGDQTACETCHGEYPHSKKPLVRTLMNMHTQFIGCMTCHTDPEAVPYDARRLRWLNFSGVPVEGKPFGTSIDPSTGRIAATDDVYSRIVAYADLDGSEQLLELTPDQPRVREFTAAFAGLSGQERESMKQAFHRRLTGKGPECQRCHTGESESYIPFRGLDFSEARINTLTGSNVTGFVTKYETFHLPALRGGAVRQPGQPVQAGQPDEAPAAGMRGNPREWFEKQFDAPPAGGGG